MALFIVFGLQILFASSSEGLLSIDLTLPPAPIITGHLGMGAAQSPAGDSIDADSRCLYRNGQPWLPVMGEIHFSRCPRQEWRDELLKMKAGGIDVVATYVFWIHHEQQQGNFDWTGQRSLRDFLLLCRELNMPAVVRLGPWCHGEVRNGGFPEWVQHAEFWAAQKGIKKRSAHPEFMKLVAPYYRQIAAQLKGLLWKDGGPVIGVQLDNECGDLGYLMALKALACENGIDVPFYTMTGWNRVAIPKEGLLPLFGAYADGFWSSNKQSFRKAFFFTPVRDDGDMGAIDGRLGNVRPERNLQIERFPYVCCEIGGGMMSSYERRLYVFADDTAAISLARLGSGNNMPGYYMYHGGINPASEAIALNETKATGYPNDLPVMDYDFNAPLGACGQVRDHYHLLRQQHLFLRDFGHKLAVMRAFFPEQQPQSLDDVAAIRWSVRSDGQAGFLFFNNHQRYQELPDKKDIQFTLKTRNGQLQIPRDPITIPSGSYGFWPVNLDCGGITVQYATVQPLCQLEADGKSWFFFMATDGIRPEFMLKTKDGPEFIDTIRPGSGIAFSRQTDAGKSVNFAVVTARQAKQLWKIPFAGRQRIILCDQAVLAEADGRIRIESMEPRPVELAIFPAGQTAFCDEKPLKAASDGLFERFALSAEGSSLEILAPQSIRAAQPSGEQFGNPMVEESWKDAAMWTVTIPKDRQNQDVLMRIHYAGDVARVYAGGKLVVDHFYNGRPFDVALWRLDPQRRDSIAIHIMPLQKNTSIRLPDEARPDFGGDQSYAVISKVELIERKQWAISLQNLPVN